jgi:abortive infection bacteriophage resistance protein
MADSKPLKVHATYSQQLEKLRARGLSLTHDAFALAALERLGYYRLSGYFYPLRKTKPFGEAGRLDDFQEGASFELVLAIAEFDKRLRLLSMYAIESVELAVRVAIAHHLGKFDPEAHLKPALLDGKFTKPRSNGRASQYEEWLLRFNKMLGDSKEDFVTHHLADYGGHLPIWVAIEIWDFGMLSRFFAGMESRDRNRLGRKFGAVDGETLKSWLRAFNFVRNVAAHHSRLWNRRNTEILLLPTIERCRWLEPLHKDTEGQSKIFGALSCLILMMRQISPDSDWLAQLKSHLVTFPKTDLLSLKAAGFPDDWENLPLWQSK